MAASAPGETFRFRDFELDVAAYELRRQGRPVKLGRQPMDLLILLVERRRQLVSRSDIVERLWGKDVFVDVETGVNTAISKIRQALRDSPECARVRGDGSGQGVSVHRRRRGASRRHAGAPGLADRRSRRHRSRVRNPASATPARLAIGLLVVAMVTGVVAWTWLRGGAVASRVTLAVLPFANIGSDPEREYLAAGLTEETSASLAQIDPERLIVKGRTLRYKGTTKTAVEIGQELSVDYLVESTIRAEGGRLRVTATLIRVRDQEHVWSQSYEREPTSLLGLQQELSTAIAEQIRVRLSPDDVRRVGGRQTQNADAFDAYLRGRYLESRRTPATNARAIQEYQRAIALDPNYALAWSSLAFHLRRECRERRCPSPRGGAARRETPPRTRSAPIRISRSRRSPSGTSNWLLDWDWTAAETAFRLRDSSRSQQRGGVSHAGTRALADPAGMAKRSRPCAARASSSRWSRSATRCRPRSRSRRGEYPAAIEHARRAVLIDSEFWIGYVELGTGVRADG